VAAAVTIAHIVGFAFVLFLVNRVLPGVAVKTVLGLLPAYAAGFIMALGLMVCEAPILKLVDGQPSLLSLLLMVAIGAVIYGLAALLLQRALLLETFWLLISVFRRRGAAHLVRR
jgi:hypothetical protein